MLPHEYHAANVFFLNAGRVVSVLLDAQYLLAFVVVLLNLPADDEHQWR
jgi:hypothetical protein